MRLGYRVPIAGLLLCLISNTSSASVPGHLKLAPDTDGNECEIADPGQNGVVTVYVVARGFNGVAGFHFSAPIPTSSGLVHLSDQSAYFPIGSSQTAVDIDLGTCESGTFVVMQMQFLRANQGDPCTFYGAALGATYLDCSFGEFPAQVVGVMLNSDGTCTQARQLGPADGATNGPVSPSLSWDPGFTCFLSTGSVVYLGTSPNPPQVAVSVQSPYSIGPLQPGTKYYWKIADPGAGPVWSFTTTSNVAARSSTWGAIKALYR